MKELFTKKMMRISKVTVISLVALLFVTFAGHAFAANLQYQVLAPLPGIDSATASNLPSYLIAIFKLMIGLAALLAVVMITIGGLEYMSTDAISGKEDGKERIKQALYGLFLAMGAWLILYTVNPKLIEFNLGFAPAPSISAPAATGSNQNQTPGSQVSGEFQKNIYCYSQSEGGSDPRATATLGTFPYEAGNQDSFTQAREQCYTTSPPVRYNFQPTGDCPQGTTSESYRCDNVTNP